MSFVPRKQSRTRSSLLSLFAVGTMAMFSAPAACDSSPELLAVEGGACDTAADCSEGLACSNDGTCRTSCETADDCGSEQFCSTAGTCESQCASCGSACTETDDCPTGQFCIDQSCQQECEPGNDDTCPGSEVCTENGQCLADTTIVIGNGGEGGMGGGDGNKDCIDVDVDFEPQIPNVVLLIDRSGSMNAGGGFGDAVNDAIGDGSYTAWDCDEPTWRYNVVRNILLHPDNGIVKPLEENVRFGLALYSSPGDADESCPQLLEVDLGFGTHANMLSEFNCEDYLTHTPSRESLTATAEKLAAMDIDGPKVIVFATDGAPDNCECRDWDDDYGTQCDENDSDNDEEIDGTTYSTSQAEQYRVVQEAQRINEELGIIVEVINVSSPGNTALAAHLDDVAERGGAVSGASIDGFDPGALGDAFNTIIDGVRSCAIDLDGEIEPGKEDTGTVKLDGGELFLDDANGWVVNSPTQIELVGDACETIKTGEHDLDISFPCGAFVPIVLK